MSEWTWPIFYTNAAAHLALIGGVVWCIAVPQRRLYPMANRDGVFYVMWGLFYFIFATNFALVVLDWNSGLWTSLDRLFLAGPLVALGAALTAWGMATLGTKNTSGLRDGFVRAGPYSFTRNPQYVGDITLFLGVAMAANSSLVLTSHLLTSLVFVLAPLAEEPWLKEQYEGSYVEYRRSVPRFL